MSARDDLIDEYGRATTAPLGTLSDLRVKLSNVRAEVLREAADAINALPQDYECDPGRGDAAELLLRMADGAGKDTREGEFTRQLTHATLDEIDDALDDAGIFSKGYFATVDGATTLVGLRIGNGPQRVVAQFGDTVVLGADGSFSVRRAADGGDTV